MTIKANELQKSGVERDDSTPKEEAKKVKTVSEIFLEECNTEEAEIFAKIKKIMIENCDKYEFEAVTENNLDDYAQIITYVKHGIIELGSDGVIVNLRKPLKADGKELTKKLKILYERDETLERIFTSGIKVSKKSIESQKDFTLATLAASFDKVDGKRISVDTIRGLQSNNYRDYMLLLTVFNFFRN